MKVVFLDFDGVLNNLEDQRNFLPECVAQLNCITDATGAGIVVHSSWREGTTLEQMQAILLVAGITGTVIDLAPVPDFPSPDGETREFKGYEGQFKYERLGSVAVWLDRNPGVETFVILDDDGRFEHLTDRLVNTSYKTPLNQAHADRAIEMFG